jgi:hypothetical protein
MTDEINKDDVEEVLRESNAYFPEAPVSITIQGYCKGFSVLITKRNGAGKVEIPEIVKTIDNMIVKGFKPSWNEATNKQAEIAQATGQGGEAETANEAYAPLCPVHKKAMTKRTGKYGEFWSCGTKLSDGTWCKERPEEVKKDWITCENCDLPIEQVGNLGPAMIADYSRRLYGKTLCFKCQGIFKSASSKG